MAASSERNGRATLAIILSVIALVVGLVVGGMSDALVFAKSYVPLEQYRLDQGKRDRQLNRIEEKLDDLLLESAIIRAREDKQEDKRGG